MKMKHHPHSPHSRGLASKIMRNPSAEPAGLIGGSDVEKADRMGMRGARGMPPAPPSSGGFGMAPGAGGGPMGPPPGGKPPGMPPGIPDEGGGL